MRPIRFRSRNRATEFPRQSGAFLHRDRPTKEADSLRVRRGVMQNEGKINIDPDASPFCRIRLAV
jgi:hypothetical protein